ncbi:hypothetical protein NECAME_19686 [Necator americanus]|uniref:Uncharacterized protein n=1 Tax=Necator americanus TaxID=51031 RepID=W2TJ42_NECAM|nr:hypothetical protein NECAME_19686 [Necator americanus]ETN82125.1 hypothetical protein NECAME_19686 [Necator americanus]
MILRKIYVPIVLAYTPNVAKGRTLKHSELNRLSGAGLPGFKPTLTSAPYVYPMNSIRGQSYPPQQNDGPVAQGK